MSDSPTSDDVRKSVEPKSDQLNADDLVSGPITVTVTEVRKGDREQPIVVELEGHRPYKPCKTMRRVLIAAFSDDPKAWIGQRMTLFCDPNVTWAGVKVGGIRISHLSGLSEPRTFLLTTGRGKRTEVTILPLPLDATEQGEIAQFLEDISCAESEEALKAIGFVLKTKSKAVQNAVRGDYARRKDQLRPTNTRIT